VTARARLTARLLGTGNVLVVHRFTIDMLSGDHLAALFLEQLLYWTERTNNPDGWIVKTYAEWQDELCLSKYLVGRIAQTLEPFGVETTVRRSPFHKMQPALHYRVNLDALEVKIRTFIESEDFSLSESEGISLSESEAFSLSITETTAETTTEGGYTPPLEPIKVRLLQNDTAAQANGWTLVDAYAEVTGMEPAAIWPSAKKTAAGLASGGFTAEDVRAFLTEMKADPNQSFRWNGYRFAYLGEDLQQWKRRQAERPAPARVLSDRERAAQEQALEAERVAWRKEQGLL
jgi:hypothetical protein